MEFLETNSFQILYILFIGFVAGFSYWYGHRDGEMYAIDQIVEHINESKDSKIEIYIDED